MKKANFVVGIALMMAVKAHSGEVIPKEFYYQYDTIYELVLLPDVCDKSDISQGWQAEARNLETKAHADGCWQYGKFETVLIVLDAGDGKYLDYQLYKTKFLPRY